MFNKKNKIYMWYKVQELHRMVHQDNARLLSAEIIDEINILVIETGHSLTKKKRTKN